jgi:hypothetical protein
LHSKAISANRICIYRWPDSQHNQTVVQFVEGDGAGETDGGDTVDHVQGQQQQKAEGVGV